MDVVRVRAAGQVWLYSDPDKARDAARNLRSSAERMVAKAEEYVRGATEIERQCAELEVKLAAKAEARRAAKKEQVK